MKKTRTSGHLPRTSTFPDKDRTPEKEGRCRGGFMEPQKFNARGNFGNRWGKGGSEIYSVCFCFPEAWAIEETYLRLIILDEWGQESYPQRVRESWGLGGTVVKNPLANAWDTRDEGSIPGWGRSPGGGHSSPLQYSCLENPIDRGVWQATVHGVMKSRAQLKRNILLLSITFNTASI